MALNWTMLNPSRAPVPLPNEMTITTISDPSGGPAADLVLTIPDTPPSGPSSSSGGNGGSRRRQASGRLWLTDQRLIFVASKPSAAGGSRDPGPPNAGIETLSVPLHSILSTRFEQPTFGANYLTFEIKPSPGGGLADGTKAELRFPNRAMFEFVSLLEKTRERAIYMKRQMAEEVDESLPTYTMPAESSTVVMVGGVPVENPPGYDA